MLRTFLICAAVVGAPSAGAAQTLEAAMTQALSDNPDYLAAQARFQASREAIPQARAEALPQVALGASATRSDGAVDGVGLGASEDWRADASASQLLFSGGRVFAATRQARARVAAAEADLARVRQTVLVDVTAAYAGVRQAQASVAAREQSVANLAESLAFAQAQAEAGVLTRTDAAQAQARLAQGRTQLVQARGALAAAVETYLRVVGAPPDALTAPTSPALPDDLPAALALAETNSPTLRAALAAEAAAQAAIGVAAAGGRLRASLEAGAGLAGGFEEDAPETSSDSVGVRLSLPLFQGGLARSRTREARAGADAARFDRIAAERAVRQAVTTTWSDVQTARAALASAREQLSAAELAYRGVTLEREVGLRATVEILDQEQELLNARLAVADAERALAVAERQALAAIGTLDAPQ